MLAQRLVFVGHISVDKVENVNGTRVQPGGAALYAAMAARTLSPNVTLISATGKDNQFLNVLDLLPYKDVKIYDAPSTRFHIRYDRRWEAHCLGASAPYLLKTSGVDTKLPRDLLIFLPSVPSTMPLMRTLL